MPFKPTPAQLETIAELQTARMPRALIADRLGVDQATFKAWAARLDAARDYVEPTESIADILRKLFPDRSQREHESRMVADRMFEGN
jgi:hypothetical protein